MKLAYDSRPAHMWHGVGRYARCLLDALVQSGRGDIVESRDPRRGDVFHSPWIEGAPLRSPVPSVVTLHDLVPLKRPGDYLRTGLRFKLRYLAVQRATMVIVPTRTVADDAIRALDIPAEPDRGDPRGGRAGVLEAARGGGGGGPRALRAPRPLPAVGRHDAPARPAQARGGPGPRGPLDAARPRRTGEPVGA